MFVKLYRNVCSPFIGGNKEVKIKTVLLSNYVNPRAVDLPVAQNREVINLHFVPKREQ